MSTSAAAASARPTKPRPSPWRWVIVAAVVAFTWFAAEQTRFSIPELIENFTRANDLAKEFWPPAWEVARGLVDPFLETIQIAVIGTIVGCGLAIPLSFLAAYPTAPGTAVRVISRFSMNILRTMPDLFWAILFATAVGFGPFAGAVALSIFALAIMAKLFSETVDAIETGPLEAVRATGASRFQAVRRAVWPQVRPNFVAYAFYIFELLIRASVVLGLVGAGGVGTSLNRWRQFFQYDRVMVLVLITLVIVLTLEAVGALVRKRLS